MRTTKVDLSGAERRSQETARSLCDSGFQIIIYGAEDDPEVRKVLAFTQGNGVAILNPEEEIELHRRKIALLAQESRSAESFSRFVTRFLALNIGRIYELRVIYSSRVESVRMQGSGVEKRRDVGAILSATSEPRRRRSPA
jgi:hypothetical protein